MANAFPKIKLSYPNLFFSSLLALLASGLVHLIVVYSQMVSTNAAKIETEEFQMEIDPDSIDVSPVPMIPRDQHRFSTNHLLQGRTRLVHS